MKTHALIIILAIMLHLPNASTAQVNTQDSLALIALYNSTDGANWTNTWNLSQPVTNWYGITVTNNRVARMWLDNNNLTGILPPEIGYLDTLTILSLINNNLSGNIPSEISNLNYLRRFMISNNSLTGKLPNEIGNLLCLHDLDLRNNQFTDTLPSSICNLTQIQTLYIDNNMFSGPIPDSIGKLTNLINFEISNNLFTIIPPSISQLTCLYYDLRNNPFIDSLPSNMFANYPTIGQGFIYLNNCNIKKLPLSFPANSLGLFIENNSLTFGDFEPVIINNYQYNISMAPQDSICEAIDTTVHIGDTITLETITDGQFNVYNWKKDGFTIINNNSQELTINGATLNDAGIYTCEVTNTLVTGLTLNRKHIILRVDTTTYAQIDKKFDNIFINYNPETHKAIFTGIDSVDKITIYDMAGKMVYQKNATTLPLEITLPQRGSYIAHITAKGKNKVLKF